MSLMINGIEIEACNQLANRKVMVSQEVYYLLELEEQERELNQRALAALFLATLCGPGPAPTCQ